MKLDGNASRNATGGGTWITGAALEGPNQLSSSCSLLSTGVRSRLTCSFDSPCTLAASRKAERGYRLVHGAGADVLELPRDHPFPAAERTASTIGW